MQTSRPRIQRTYVQLIDPNTKERVCFTVYGADPADIKRQIHRGTMDATNPETKPRRQKQPA